MNHRQRVEDEGDFVFVCLIESYETIDAFGMIASHSAEGTRDLVDLR